MELSYEENQTMSVPILEKLPQWVPLFIMLLPWFSVITDIIKTRSFSSVFRAHINLIYWGIKTGIIIMGLPVFPLPKDPWLLIVIVWMGLDMKQSWYTEFLNRIGEKKDE